MPSFTFQAREGNGELITGTLEAPSVADVGRMLRAQGKFVVKVTDAVIKPDEKKVVIASGGHKVKREEVIHFAHQLAVMIDTGVNIGEALESISEQTNDEAFKAVLTDVSDRVHGGTSFSDALAAHPTVFPVLMVSLIRASEASGTMGSMLEQISQYLTKERNTLKKIRGAMIYPMVMMVVAMGVTIFLLTFVLPRFNKIYQTRGAALPAPTQLLLTVSHITTTYWYVFVGLAVLLFGAILWMRVNTTGRRWLDWLKLRLPIVGGMFNQLYITRAMRTMSTMITAGVPIMEMINITRDVTNNVYYEGLWDEVDLQIQQGAQLSAAMFDSPLIPSAIARMIHSGEKAGRLGQVMDRIAEFTEHDFDESVKRTTEFIEPAMVTFMGGMIGFVAISLLLPIFSVGRVMAGG